MTGLLRMLADILRDHIERVDPAVTVYTLPADMRIVDRLPPISAELLDDNEQLTVRVRDTGELMTKALGSSEWQPVPRPCWCCGHPGGFTDPHRCIQRYNPGSQPHTFWSTQ